MQDLDNLIKDLDHITMLYTDLSDKDTISMALVNQALQHAAHQAINTDEILKSAGIQPERLASIQDRVSVQQFSTLWIGLANAMNDEFFGMDRHPMRRGSYKLISKLIYSRPTLLTALQDLLSLLNLILDDLDAELVIEQPFAKIVIHDRASIKPMFAYATYLMLIHTLMCWLAEQRLPLQKIQVRCEAPEYDQDYKVRFCTDISYQQAANIISFDTEYLNIKIKKDAEDWYYFLKSTPQNLLLKFKNPHSLSYNIRKMLLQHAPNTWPELENLALQLHISEATLQRRLKKEGVNYQQLKNEIRKDQAIYLLNNTSHNLDEISHLLAFQDCSAFNRAFKKWTGIPPGSYRQNNN